MLAAGLLSAVLAGAAPASAQEEQPAPEAAAPAQDPEAAVAVEVLILLPPGDPIAEAMALELAQRGLRAGLGEPPRAFDPAARAEEARVLALAVGARAVVWMDGGGEPGVVTIRVLRADDAAGGDSALASDHVVGDARLAALVGGTLAQEILARPVGGTPIEAALPESAGAAVIAAVQSGEPSEVEPSTVRAYGAMAFDGLLRIDPLGPGFGARGSVGAEWPDGFRIGAHARVFGVVAESVADELGSATGTLPGVFLGGEIAGRIPIEWLALTLGASVGVGASMHFVGHDTAWGFGAVIGGVAALMFPARTQDDEFGVQIGVDAWIEEGHGVSPVVSLAFRRDWR